MKLLIQLTQRGGLASLTAIPATFATVTTHKPERLAVVATVAGIAEVENPQTTDQQSAPKGKTSDQPDETVENAVDLPAEVETAIRLWLESIGEKNPGIIMRVLDQCKSELDAREYFLRRSRGLPY